MKVVLTGGGTAGHVNGNMALVPELKKRGADICYIGRKPSMEYDIVSKDPSIAYYVITAGKFRRTFSLKNVTDAFKVMQGYQQAKKILKEIQPDIVFSKGGFVTVPVVAAAKKLGIPVIIHESDSTPGLANRISGRYADRFCTTFPETVEMLNSQKAICTGPPLRKELFEGSRTLGLRLCGFDEQKPVVIVMGGSSGAQAINELVRKSLEELLKSFQVIHICGKDGMDASLNHLVGYKQYGYVTDELPHLLAASDIAVSRAGANAIFEFLAAQIPMLLIPLPKTESRGDQILNAESFEKSGYAIMRVQEKLTPETFVDAVHELYRKAPQIKSNMSVRTIKNGRENILQMIDAFCENSQTKKC